MSIKRMRLVSMIAGAAGLLALSLSFFALVSIPIIKIPTEVAVFSLERAIEENEGISVVERESMKHSVSTIRRDLKTQLASADTFRELVLWSSILIAFACLFCSYLVARYRADVLRADYLGEEKNS